MVNGAASLQRHGCSATRGKRQPSGAAEKRPAARSKNRDRTSKSFCTREFVCYAIAQITVFTEQHGSRDGHIPVYLRGVIP
jgi:hypothetical protein